jgi:hypothetical protein
MDKSTRHSKITGDFAETLVLYWLSKYGYECARVDHTGIDLIACSKDGSERMGISVKARSRYDGTEQESINLSPDGFDKARQSCRSFGCVPFYAILVDSVGGIRCFLLPLDHLEKIATGKGDGVRYWPMGESFLNDCRDEPKIRWFELRPVGSSWGGGLDGAQRTRVRKPTRACPDTE